MQKVGVEAIVAGLGSFLGDMGKVDKSIKGLIPGSNLLSRAFEGVGSVVQWLTGSVFRVLEHALGEILADAFQWAASKAMELVESAIELGGELQSLKIRLDNLNFVAMTDAEREAADAMELVNQKTQEQIDWIQKLNLRSPFTTEDISTVYGMARSYGFADEEARGFVETMADWTAGMDLGGDAMKSVIRQFGQMRNKGKIMQQDLNALAEGGMVPVNNILDIMREKTGLTGSAFDDFKKSGEGVEMFIQTFTEFVGNNFANAAEKANRTFKNATNTFKDMLATFMAKGITLPLLDILGEKIASVNDAFMVINDDIQAGFDRIGTVIGNIVTGLFDLGGGAEGMADSFLAAVEGVADWLETHQGDIQKWLEDGVVWIRNVAIPKVIELKDWLFGTEEKEGFIQKIATFIEEKVIPAFEKIKTWVSENEETIKTFFATLGEIISGVFSNITGSAPQGDLLQGLLGGLTAFMTFVSENKDAITEWVTGFVKAAVIFEVLGVVAGFIGKALLVVITVLAVLTPIISGLGSIVTSVAGIFGVAFSQVIIIIAAVAAAIALLYLAWQTNFGGIRDLLTSAWERMQPAFQSIKEGIAELIPVFKDSFGQMGEAFKGLWDFISPSLGGILAVIVGIVIGIVHGIAEGIGQFLKVMKYIISGVTTFISGVVNLFTGWWTLIQGLFTGNGEKIKEGWDTLWKGVGQILSGAFQLIAGLLTSNLAFLLGFIKGFVTGVFGFFKDLYNKLVGHSIVPEMMQAILNTFVTFFNQIIGKIVGFVSGVIEKFNDVRNRILSIDWLGIGTSIIDGIRNGITNAAASLASAAVSAAQSALSAARQALGIRSPSTEFFHIGEQLMQGFAEGITATADLAAKAMRGATAGTISIGAMAPARLAGAMAPGTVSNNTTNNLTLNMNTSAPSENIIADFEMMRSMVS